MSFPTPVAFIAAALAVGKDAVKLLQALKTNDKAAAVADTLDALPAFATMVGEPVADIQAVVTADTLSIAFDLEQEAPTIIALVKTALAAYRGTPAP